MSPESTAASSSSYLHLHSESGGTSMVLKGEDMRDGAIGMRLSKLLAGLELVSKDTGGPEATDDTLVYLRVDESVAVSGTPEVYEFYRGKIVIDHTAHMVKAYDRPVQLTYTEFNILSFLGRNKGIVKSRDDILRSSFKPDDQGINLRTIDVHIRRIREKLGDVNPALRNFRHGAIMTIFERGYSAHE